MTYQTPQPTDPPIYDGAGRPIYDNGLAWGHRTPHTAASFKVVLESILDGVTVEHGKDPLLWPKDIIFKRADEVRDLFKDGPPQGWEKWFKEKARHELRTQRAAGATRPTVTRPDENALNCRLCHAPIVYPQSTLCERCDEC